MGDDESIGRRAVLAAGALLLGAPALAADVRPRLRRLAPGLDRIVARGTAVEVIATGIKWAEGPLWLPSQRALLFTDPPANIIRRWPPARGTGVFMSPSGAPGTDPRQIREPGANGLALDRAGRLLIANSGGRSIDRVDLRTGARTTLVSRYGGRRFNSPNDMHVARDGAIYFTDPPYGLTEGDASPLKEQPVNGVYRFVVGQQPILIDGTLSRPNGIALSPDERRLFVSVSDEAAPRIMVYDLDRRGLPIRSRVWLDARPLQVPGAKGLPDGMKIAPDGTMFCSVPGGMMILTPDATPLGLVEADGPIANCALGAESRTLFMTASDRVLRMPLR
ncbi:MAG: SMP-30/gluconolactonase/LRE family protein [Sphingomonas sp.]|nr:MAG: SMP-30/gluconolactonase/LRE family protein [Sphingomonas sp.]